MHFFLQKFKATPKAFHQSHTAPTMYANRQKKDAHIAQIPAMPRGRCAECSPGINEYTGPSNFNPRVS